MSCEIIVVVVNPWYKGAWHRAGKYVFDLGSTKTLPPTPKRCDIDGVDGGEDGRC